MYSIQILINYILHQAGTLSGTVCNSFVLDFKHNVLRKKAINNSFKPIERYRSELLRNMQIMDPFDHGAGSRGRQKRRTIGKMTRIASVSPAYGRLLYNLVSHYQPDCILELGTALGISTMYLALGNSHARVITVEGNPQLAEIASKSFNVNLFNNITLINSTFDLAIPHLVLEMTGKTLIFIDGNHTFDATLRYFELFGVRADSSTIFVFDDINWSGEMARVWKHISGSPVVGLKIDLFHMGIVFQGRGNDRKVYRMRH